MCILRTKCNDDEKMTNLVDMKFDDFSCKRSDSNVIQIINEIEILRVIIILQFESCNFENFLNMCINDLLPGRIKIISGLFDAK